MNFPSILLLWQGFYYATTGLWAIVSIQTFSAVTQHQGDYFLKHTNALLFLMLGIFFLAASQKKDRQKVALFILAGTSFGVALIDFIYLPHIGNPLPFRLDMFEESIVAALAIFLSVMSRVREI